MRAARSGSPTRALELAEAGDLRLAGHLAELAVLGATRTLEAAQEARAEVNERRAAEEASTMARGVFSWAAAESRRALEDDGAVSAARIAAAAGALALVCLATYRIRTGRPRPGRAGRWLAAAVLTLFAADATAALPDGEDAVRGRRRRARRAGPTRSWRAMAFLETSIPPVTLVFPGEWAVMLGGRDGRRGPDRHRAADRARLGLLRGRRLGHVRPRPPPRPSVPARPRLAGSG